MKTIYIEPDEEIISIIEKIGQEPADELAVVAPSGSGLCQSLVNLKLLAKEARSRRKKVTLITKDKVGERLARQVGLAVYASPPPAPLAEPEKGAGSEAKRAVTVTETLPDGTTVHRFMPPQVKGDNVEGVELSGEISTLPIKSDKEVKEETSEPVADQPISETVSNPESLPSKSISEFDRKSAELPPVVTAIRRGNGWNRQWSWSVIPWRSALLATIIVFVCLAIVYVFLPRATVTLKFPATPKSQAITLTVKANDNTGELTILGNLLESEKSGEKIITATGQKNVGSKATGSITITNKFRDSSGAGKDQYFPAGTPVTDNKTKKVFLLDRAVTVGRVTYNPVNGQPIYQSVSVAVTATAPGEDYNIAASTFSIEGQLSNTEVTSSSAFSGGSSRQVTVLSQEDVDKAVAELTAQLANDANSELTKKAAGQTILDGSTHKTVTSQKINQEIGSQTDQAKLEMAIRLTTLVFDRGEAELKLTQAMEKDVPDSQQLVIPTDKPIGLTFQALNAENTEMTIEAKGEGFVVPKVDRQALARRLNRKSVSAARSYLEQNFPSVRSDFNFTPAWWPKLLPLLPQSIEINLGFYEATGT